MLINEPPVQFVDALIGQIRADINCRAYLADYAARVTGHTPAAHHRLMCDAAQAMWEVPPEESPYSILVTSCPPAAAKTTYLTVAQGAYYMGRFPDRCVVLMQHSEGMAQANSKKIRTILLDVQHQRLFPLSSIAQGSAGASHWMTGAGGELKAMARGSAILGTRADLVLLDDISGSTEDAGSPTLALSLAGWFDGDLITRSKEGCTFSLVGQRLHVNDLPGHIIRTYDSSDPTRIRKIRNLVLKMVAVEGDDDPLHRQPGEYLWPEKFLSPGFAAIVDDMRRDPIRWAAMYQQRPPYGAGAFVPDGSVKVISQADVPDNCLTFGASDLATTVGAGDASVHLIAKVDGQNNIYIVDGRRQHVSSDVNLATMLEMSAHWNPAQWLVEGDMMVKVLSSIAPMIQQEAERRLPIHIVKGVGQNKRVKAAPLQGMINRGQVFVVRARWNEWLLREIYGFGNLLGDAVDDAVDCAGLFARHLNRMGRPTPPTPPTPPPPPNRTASLDEMYEERDRLRNVRGGRERL